VQPIVVERKVIKPDEWEASYRYRIKSSTGTSETVTIERQKEYYRTTMRYVVTNAKSQAVSVDVIQSGIQRYWYGDDTRIVSESIEGAQLNADERIWKVPVPANGETTLTVTFDTRW
jgi:hypothetical protein